jgi:Domain of unknown function (DUF4124)
MNVCRATTWLVGAVATAAALAFASAAPAATIYRWVDKAGKTHFGDTVPSEYRNVAKPIENKVTAPSAEEQRQAIERAAQASKPASSAVGAASAASAASAPKRTAVADAPTPKRPPQAPTENTNCQTWLLLYLESLDCFGPYRTVGGATKAEAFEHCTPVIEPPPRCARNAP